MKKRVFESWVENDWYKYTREGILEELKYKSSKEDIKEISLPQNAFISEKDFNAFKEYAKEQGLTNKQAQALLEKQDRKSVV